MRRGVAWRGVAWRGVTRVAHVCVEGGGGRPTTALVSVMGVNNEIGVVQPLKEIGALCRKHKAFFHSDIAQMAGKIPIDVNECNIDLASISGHKLYGPKGIGASPLLSLRVAHANQLMPASLSLFCFRRHVRKEAPPGAVGAANVWRWAGAGAAQRHTAAHALCGTCAAAECVRARMSDVDPRTSLCRVWGPLAESPKTKWPTMNDGCRTWATACTTPSPVGCLT